ncbi:MAG: hypothetical protein WCC64_22135 [Aliidongia sp.]
MGEAKRKAVRNAEFLRQHPRCVYCGGPPNTIDHCPPRCFFLQRQWPETFEFPACSDCNTSASLDEMAVAFLVREKLSEPMNNIDFEELKRLANGVRSNCPDLYAEWLQLGQLGPVGKKRVFREMFGEYGDVMRREKYGLLNIGELSHLTIQRFLVKLGKALYYKHTDRLFDGVIYATQYNSITKKYPDEFFEEILRMAPWFSDTRRNGQLLTEQFSYKFNCSPEHEVLYAVVRFSAQFIMQLIVIGWKMENRLIESGADPTGWPPNLGRHECPLKHTQGSLAGPELR